MARAPSLNMLLSARSSVLIVITPPVIYYDELQEMRCLAAYYHRSREKVSQYNDATLACNDNMKNK